MPVLSTVEAQLYLHKHNIAKEPEKHRNVKKLVANYETTMVVLVLQYKVFHVA